MTHAFDEPLDVAYRRFRQHTMAEIENKWALRESDKNCLDRAVQRRSAGKQGQRIEIALNRPPLLDHRPRKLKLDRPIKPNRIDCNRVEIATELRAGAARKADDASNRRRWRPFSEYLESLAKRREQAGFAFRHRPPKRVVRTPSRACHP